VTAYDHAMAASPWEQLEAGITLPFHPDLQIPELHQIELDVPTMPAIEFIEETARKAVVEQLSGSVTSGMTVAVGGGSRGLTSRVELLRGAINGLRDLGAEPFLVPAMGSHGGAKAEGQRAMLESLGMTEEALGVEIRATMETVEIAHTAGGMPLYLDKHAAGADRVFPVNRIKPHTCFRGPIESGLAKMTVVGFGKQPGAAQIHSCGPIDMRNRILDGIEAVKATGRLLGGLASIESPSGDVVRIEALRGEQIGGERERELTDLAKLLVPGLPFAEIDVLIIEEGGKDISGTTMDPNVTGRFWVHALDDLAEPDVHAIVLLSITEISAGNVLGIGFADFIPSAVAKTIDWQKTYVNCFTAGIAGLRRARMPMVLASEDDCIKAALSMCGRDLHAPKRVVRIESTLHMTTCWISDALLDHLPAGARLV